MISNFYNFNYSLVHRNHKPVILFLHGFIGNLHEFEPVIELISPELSYLTVDLPGHGNTQVLAGNEYYTMENTAKGIINLLDDLQITQCCLVGYSMGGRLALYLTLNYPTRFSKVILESASPGLATETARLNRIKQDTQIARKLARINTQQDFTTFLINWYSQPIFGPIKNHPHFPFMLEKRLQNHPINLSKSLQFMGTGSQPSLWHQLTENQVPLLLLAGEYDQKFIDVNVEIARICTTARIEIINHAGHNTHLENTQQFIQKIIKFITYGLSTTAD